MSGTSFNGPCEADFFSRQVVEDRGPVLFQFGVEVAIRLDHCFGDLRQERFVEVEFAAEAGGAADDHAADVVAPDVAGDDAIGDQEGGRASMVADDAIGREIGVHLLLRSDR